MNPFLSPLLPIALVGLMAGGCAVATLNKDGEIFVGTTGKDTTVDFEDSSTGKSFAFNSGDPSESIQAARSVGNTYLNGKVLTDLAGITAGTENLKTKEGAKTDRAGITADTRQAELNAATEQSRIGAETAVELAE